MRTLSVIVLALFLLTTSSCYNNHEPNNTEINYSETVTANEQDNTQTIIKTPPALSVIYGNESITALKGTSSWKYANDDGTSTAIESDSMHPLQAKEYMTPLVLMPSIYSHFDPHTAYLCWEYVPDSVSVKCWNESCWNKFDSEFTEITVTVPDSTSEDKYFSFNINDGNYIYEVIATWEDNQKYGGTAYYSFYTQKPDLKKDLTPISENNELCGYPLKQE